MEEALFIAHFIDGKNVGDTDVLIALAESLGIDKEEAIQAVTTDQLDYEVNQIFRRRETMEFPEFLSSF